MTISTRVQTAERWLAGHLADGQPQSADSIWQHAEAADIDPVILTAAAHRLRKAGVLCVSGLSWHLC